MKTQFNYLVGRQGHLPQDYDYKNRPDPDTNGCKRLYDDIIKAFFVDEIMTNAKNHEQQIKYSKAYDKISNKTLWQLYRKLNNENAQKESDEYKPPFYTIIYKDYFLSADYIGPSIYWAEQSGLTDSQIVSILDSCRTIGGHIVWPRAAGKSINEARGGSRTVYDRPDWTFYLIKLFCDNDFSYSQSINKFVEYWGNEQIDRVKPVLLAIDRYKEWLMEFGNSAEIFNNFCNQFKLKGSFVSENLEIIWLAPPFPVLPKDYLSYANRNAEAIKKRNSVISLMGEK